MRHLQRIYKEIRTKVEMNSDTTYTDTFYPLNETNNPHDEINDFDDVDPVKLLGFPLKVHAMLSRPVSSH